jgi:hypothetical protein
VRTRTLVAISLATVVAAPLAAGASTGTTPGKEVQKITGTVAAPNPTKSAPVVVTRHNRAAGLLGPETNGAVGWFFPVDRSTWGGEFAVTSTTAGADFDIIFYSDPGTQTAAPSAAAEFAGTEGDGESGIVPTGATSAVLYPAGMPNAAFTYVGRAPAQVEIGTGSLDVTIRLGGAVTWVNRTSDYTFVDGGSAFGAPLSQGTGIPIGGTFTATPKKAGVFSYRTSAGTGTVTVRP